MKEARSLPSSGNTFSHQRDIFSQMQNYIVYQILSYMCEHDYISVFIHVWPGNSTRVEFTCERDELADLVEDLKHASMIGSHRRGLTLYKKSFSGSQLVDWLQKEKGMGK